MGAIENKVAVLADGMKNGTGSWIPWASGWGVIFMDGDGGSAPGSDVKIEYSYNKAEVIEFDPDNLTFNQKGSFSFHRLTAFPVGFLRIVIANGAGDESINALISPLEFKA